MADVTKYLMFLAQASHELVPPDVSHRHIYDLVIFRFSWWRGSVVERRSLAGELSLSCARPAADG